MVSVARAAGFALCALASLGAHAAEAQPGPGFGSVLQVSLGLALVLAMVAGAAWLVRRLGVGAPRDDGIVRVRGAIAVGQRERVVVLEVRDTWLVVGVAPGRVSALHTLPRPEEAASGEASTPASHAFSQWLKRAVEKKSV